MIKRSSTNLGSSHLQRDRQFEGWIRKAGTRCGVLIAVGRSRARRGTPIAPFVINFPVNLGVPCKRSVLISDVFMKWWVLLHFHTHPESNARYNKRSKFGKSFDETCRRSAGASGCSDTLHMRLNNRTFVSCIAIHYCICNCVCNVCVITTGNFVM